MKNRLMELVEEAGLKKEVPQFDIGDSRSVFSGGRIDEREVLEVFGLWSFDFGLLT